LNERRGTVIKGVDAKKAIMMDLRQKSDAKLKYLRKCFSTNRGSSAEETFLARDKKDIC